MSFDLSNRFDDEYLILEKWNPKQAISCIYYDGDKKIYFTKRFLLDNTANVQSFMPSEHPKSFIEFVGTRDGSLAEITYLKDKNNNEKPAETINIDEFIAVKGIKTIGNQFIKEKVKSINIIVPEKKEVIEEVFVPANTEIYDNEVQGELKFGDD